METAIISAQALSGAGTQDFVSTGFGTPSAALIITHSGVTLDTDTAHLLQGMGFWDGTNSVALGTTVQDASGATNRVNSRIYSGFVVSVYGQWDAVIRTATCANITDGIRLTWNSEATRPWVQVILIKGVTGAFAGYYTPSASIDGTVNVTTTGITPNAVFNIGSRPTVINSLQGSAAFNLGFATSRGSITQACSRHAAAGVLDESRGYGEVLDGFVGTSSTIDASSRANYEITALASGQFTVATRNVAESRVQGFLALEVETAPDVFIATTPTAAGDWSPYTGNFQPDCVIMAPTALTTVNTPTIDGDPAGGMGVYAVNPSTEEGYYVADEDNVAATNTSGRRSAALIIQGEAGGAPIFSASGPTFGATGLTYASGSITTGASGYKVAGIAFASTAVTNTKPSTQPLYYGATLLANKTGIQWTLKTGHTGIGGAIIDSGTTATTDASGNLILPTANYGNVNDEVTLSLYWEEGSAPVVDRSLIVKTTLVEDV